MRTNELQVLMGVVAVAFGVGVFAWGAAPLPRPQKPWTGIIQAHKESTYGFDVSSDGNTLVTGGDLKMALWDLRTGKLIRERNFENILSPTNMLFVNGGREIACNSVDVIYIRDRQTLKTRVVLGKLGPTGQNDYAASLGGAYLATARWKTVAVWDVAKGKPLWQTKFDKEASRFDIDRIAFSPDGKLLALGVDDITDVVRLHDARSGRELRRMAGPRRSGPVRGLAFTLDGRCLVAGYRDDKTVYVWDVLTGKLVRRLQLQADKESVHVCALALSSDGKTLFVGCDEDGLQLYETVNWELRQVLPHKAYKVRPCSGDRLILEYRAEHEAGRLHIVSWRSQAKTGSRPDKELTRLWDTLGSKDAKAAFQAASELLATPDQAVTLLSRLPRADATTHQKLAKLITDLDDEDFEVRERATQKLKKAGQSAEALLRAALDSKLGPEARRRITSLLRNLDPLNPERLRLLRGVEVLEALASPRALKQLDRLASGAKDAEETQDARAALERLRKREK